MKAQLPAPESWRSLDDLTLSIRIARSARSAARSAGRELDVMLEAVASGAPPTAERLLDTEQRWFDARALADATNEAFVRVRAHQEELRRRAHDLAMPSVRPSLRPSARPSSPPSAPSSLGPPSVSAATSEALSAMTQRSARWSWVPGASRDTSPPSVPPRPRAPDRSNPHSQN